MHDLWKVLKNLPLLTRRFRSRVPALRFLDLPEDIVYEIVDHLDVRALCNLSLTCNRLYANLLTSHLHQHGVKDPFYEIHLHGNNCTAAMPALRLLLYDNPIKAFTWRAGNDPRTLVREVEQLRRLIARISIIEYLELDFSNNWPVHEFRYGHENGYWAWIRLITNLLHVVAQRCYFVIITNHYQVLLPWVSFIGGIPYNLDPPLLERICTEWRQDSKSQKLLKSPSKISLSHPDNATTTTKATKFPQPFPPEKTRTTVYATKRLIIDDPGLFQRSLFGEWALDWVNNMPLTHLVVHQGRMRLTLLRQLHLPHLTSLAISHGYGLSTSDIVQVLQNNEALTTLDFLDTKLDASSAIILVKKRKHHKSTTHIGLSMERLKGIPSFLRGMLDMELAFLRLSTVVVQVRGDGRNEMGHLHRLYGSLAEGGRANLSNLVFELPGPDDTRGSARFKLENWLLGHQEMKGGLKETMAGLLHIRVVHLQYAPVKNVEGPKHLHDPMALPNLLASWVSAFPALREIGFTHVFDPEDTGAIDEFIQCISSKLSVRVDGVIWPQARAEWSTGLVV